MPVQKEVNAPANGATNLSSTGHDLQEKRHKYIPNLEVLKRGALQPGVKLVKRIRSTSRIMAEGNGIKNKIILN